MRIFGDRPGEGDDESSLGMEEGEAHRVTSLGHQARSRRAQKAGRGAATSRSRKHLLKYDDVMNKQREAVYGLRPQDAGRRGPADAHPRPGRGHRGPLRRGALPGEDAPRHLGHCGAPRRRHRPLRAEVRESGRVRAGPAGPRGRVHRGALQALRGQGGSGRPQTHALHRAHDHAASDRPAMEGPPAVDGPPQGGHRPARLRPEGPACRIQEGVVPHLPADDVDVEDGILRPCFT